ncbi:hypothetical protein sos41_04950 [Alphaproteobacteria bacterium SO-S41]|nr:hypothetical protein sos41_04950 [Alphaproteobacteria bacterium SO-S41]
MLFALVIWTLIVAGGWWFGAALIAFATPGAAWLAANPALAEWLQPVLVFFAGQAIAAAAIVWLVGALLIALIIRPRAAARRKQALSYDEWQRLDGGTAAGRPAPAPYQDDYPRSRRWRRRRRRDDDDDDDDD